MKDMKEIRILITDIPEWDSEDWDDLECELRATMNRWLSKHDYTIAVRDVG